MLKIEIATDNAAFYEVSPGREVTKILREFVDWLGTGYGEETDTKTLFDTNGNKVGTATWSFQEQQQK